MSLGIVVKGPEGLVLAAESRITLMAVLPEGPAIHVNFDNATKLLSFNPPNDAVGVVTYGHAAIGQRTAHSFLPEFEVSLGESAQRLSVAQFAGRLSQFFAAQWQQAMPAEFAGPPMTFVVGGFDEGEPYGKVFLFEIPTRPVPVEQQPHPGEFGITWGGQREFVDRLIVGFDSGLPQVLQRAFDLDPTQMSLLERELQRFKMAIPLAAMPLQDCVDLAIFFIRTSILAQRLTVGIRGCGGPIDVAVITREGLKFVQRKQIIGEVRLANEILERSP